MNVGLINGLPGHPLFVHGAAVLVPLTALALVICALWPPAARRLGVVLPLLGLVTLGLVVLTTESGEWLEDRVRESSLVEEHAEMGPGLTPWAIALFVLTVVVWLLGHVGRRQERARGGEGETTPSEGGASTVARAASSLSVRVVVLVIALVVAAGAVIQVYRIGDSGARAAWHGRFSTSPSEAGR
ncbi:hypothetical protein B7755_030490 [Streptomyces sp. NBS 14/10]|uniref:DUF2231 domain-containing protein n=1 Tax=Streptomyces sp. NBS 14/10 TaxID=1945643 RepID=UPI000B7F2C23|nr:DUF2231 domain-containing protein [Streptomyces sp. NBS 14/10]KAK1182086.1 hypothetical protein B7755_030490 [Streptomyces sp. NBS 14/10]NUS90626.1 hypothetical protein [Streptomyces sp.]